MKWLMLLLLVGVCVAECQPIKLNRGEGLDWNCRLFRRVYRDGHLYIERLRPDRTVISIEAVDCSKAVLVEGGWMEVPMHVIAGSVYCYTAPRRKHETHGGTDATRQVARAGRPSHGAGAENHPAH